MTIEIKALSKRYALKSALDGVSAVFDSGKIHALLGENGAGKSTLAAIIAGAIKPTGGALRIDGKSVQFTCPRDALAHGIVIVQQRPLLAGALTALENLCLERGDTSAAVRQELTALKKIWAPALPLETPVQHLGGNLRFYIAFLGALLLHPRFLILDEPSAFLDHDERKALYEHVRAAVSKDDITVLVITHSGAEAETYADTVTVLHRGKLQARYDSAADYRQGKAALEGQHTAESDLLKPTDRDMRTLTASLPRGTCCFSLTGVSSRPKNKSALLSAELAAYYGEITAVTGLKEGALDTLEDVVTGLADTATTGTATLAGCSYDLARKPLTARRLRQAHTAIVPSDRTFRASHPALSIEQMLTVYLTRKEQTTPAAYAQKLITLAGVQITPQETAKNLSGGMLQRLILTRELATNPNLIILCNPLQGLDKKGQHKMTEIAVQLAEQGKAVLILGAADFPLSLCQHVYALEGGVCALSYTQQAEHRTLTAHSTAAAASNQEYQEARS